MLNNGNYPPPQTSCVQESKPQINSRVLYIDIARGLAILGVLYGHFLNISPVPQVEDYFLCGFFWSFHMPLFAFVSGFFYKHEGFKSCFTKGLKTLIIPLIIASFFTIIPGIVIDLAHYQFHSLRMFLLGQNFPAGYWFIIALFVNKIWFNAYSKAFSNHLTLALSIVFCVAIYQVYSSLHINSFQISRAIYLIPYMLFGVIVRKNNLLDILVRNKLILLVSISFILLAPLFAVNIWEYDYPLGAFNIITATLITMSVIMICQILERRDFKSIKLINTSLAFCGRHSLMLLFYQALIVHYANCIPANGSMQFIISSLLLNIVLTVVTVHILKWYKLWKSQRNV